MNWFDRNCWWIYMYSWPLYRLTSWFEKKESFTDAGKQTINNMHTYLHEWDRIYTDEFGWEPFTCNTIYNSPKKGSMTLIVTAHYGTEDIKVIDTYAIDCRKETLDLLFTRLKIEASEKLYKLEKENLKNSGFRS